METRPRTIYVRASDCISADLTGEAIILNPESGVYFSLNEVAALIWSAIETPKTQAELEAIIMETYEVGVEQCERDLLLLLGNLAMLDLVRLEDPVHA